MNGVIDGIWGPRTLILFGTITRSDFSRWVTTDDYLGKQNALKAI